MTKRTANTWWWHSIGFSIGSWAGYLCKSV